VLVDVERPRSLTVTAAGQAPELWRGPSGGRALLVAGTEPPDVVELWDWTLHPGEAHATEAHSAGTRELLLVLEGQVDLRVGDRAERLAAGDSATFAGDLGHGYACPADAAAPARFVLTVFEPNVGGGRP
jgi:quercetin dioxygenase-like cupin family protein